MVLIIHSLFVLKNKPLGIYHILPVKNSLEIELEPLNNDSNFIPQMIFGMQT